MKSTLIRSFAVACWIFLTAGLTHAQFTGKNGGTSTGFLNTATEGGQLAHIQNGSFGDFGTGDRWIGIGQPAGVPIELYGMRIQDRANLATFSLNGNGAGNKNLDIQWGRTSSSGNGSGMLNFKFATNSTTNRTVMQLDNVGFLKTRNKMRAENFSNSANFTEIGHGGSHAFLNTQGAGFLDFRHDNTTRMRLSDNGELGVNTTNLTGLPTNIKLVVNGGAMNSTGVWTTSDSRFKKNISPLRREETLERGDLCPSTQKLLQLEGVSYQLRPEKIGSFDMSFVDDSTQLGFIAQDLAELFPELVIQDSEGFYAVRYEGLIPVLVEGVKDQQAIIDQQTETIGALNTKIDRLEETMTAILEAIK